MPQTILVQSPVVERTNKNHSHGRISQTVDRRLMRFLKYGIGGVCTMNKCNSMFMGGVKRKASITLVLVALIIFIGGIPSTAALDSFQVLNWKDVPSIPITLRYSPEEVESLTGKYETRQYVFNQEEWEAWKTPGIDVTFRLNKAGDIEISKCGAFISAPEETTLPMFVATAQNIAIEGSQIRVAIIGYLDYGSYQSNEQTLAFKVRFISILKSLNSSRPKATLPIRYSQVESLWGHC